MAPERAANGRHRRPADRIDFLFINQSAEKNWRTKRIWEHFSMNKTDSIAHNLPCRPADLPRSPSAAKLVDQKGPCGRASPWALRDR
jgi:hypothetical protein